MKGIIYKTNPLIEKTRPEMPFLASDGTECYSLEEVDIINRDILDKFCNDRYYSRITKFERYV